MAGDGGHHRPAGVRVGVLHDNTVIGAAVGDGGQTLERRPGLFPGVAQQRGVGHRRLFPGRPQRPRPVLGRGGVDRFGYWLDILRVWLVEHRLQQVHQGNVQAVQPDDGLVGLVTVVVPGPVGGQHQVAGVHRNAVAVHRGVAPVAVDNEPKGRRCVPVGAGRLSRHDYLEAREEAVGGGYASFQAGIQQHQDAALRILSPYQRSGAQGFRPQLLPAPDVGHRLAPRLADQGLLLYRPEGRHAICF